MLFWEKYEKYDHHEIIRSDRLLSRISRVPNTKKKRLAISAIMARPDVACAHDTPLKALVKKSLESTFLIGKYIE